MYKKNDSFRMNIMQLIFYIRSCNSSITRNWKYTI